MPRPATKFFSDEAVLRRRQDLRVGQHRHARGEKGRRLRRHVLELVGDDVDVRGEGVERARVGIVGAGDAGATTSKAGDSGSGEKI